MTSRKVNGGGISAIDGAYRNSIDIYDMIPGERYGEDNGRGGNGEGGDKKGKVRM